jgi:23S rRNA (uracil1939-C5)-methyltransferase
VRVENEAPAPAATALIEKWVYGGGGLARIDGRVALVPFTLPGEKVRLEDRGGVHAKLLEVIEPAPERVSPPCPVFARCGGCHYQHAPYEFQLARKSEILREQLKRVGKIDYRGEIEVVSGPPYGYRNRVQLHIAGSGQGRRLGYMAAGSHELVAIEECPIASPGVNRAIAEMRARLGDPRFPPFVRSLELFTNEAEVQVNVVESDRRVARAFFDWCESSDALEYATEFGSFRVSPRSFFQVNRFLVEKLVETSLGESGGDSALDLYAGVGLFAIPMARRFQSVTAVEGAGSATRDLEFNASRAGGANVRVERARVEQFLERTEARPEFVLADPPRSGLGRTVVAELLRLAPPRLTIVSCDPSTLARDLAALAGYSIERLTMIDLFPQTYHLETVAQLVKGLKPLIPTSYPRND